MAGVGVVIGPIGGSLGERLDFGHTHTHMSCRRLSARRESSQLLQHRRVLLFCFGERPTECSDVVSCLLCEATQCPQKFARSPLRLRSHSQPSLALEPLVAAS